ncbi:hypothetical protein [Coraliomargarita parva]|uniref:hypothetical protein n=1 Tax=Coraliomargarita parva TaxID=3014050 RepID=UPI0022B5282A|nr:hypothetical protein [Coraliomargarita parva]
MDNLLEFIIPLIVAGVYFFINFLSNRASGGEEDPRRRGRGGVDPDVLERQRRIQEEIRRKIMERRQAASGAETPPVATEAAPRAEELRQRRAEIEHRRELRERQKAVRERARGTVEAPHGQPAHAGPDPVSPTFAYEQNMQAQLERIEETKRRAAALKKQANAAGVKVRGARTHTARSEGRGILSGPIRENLSDPQAARAAFLYGEVLGRPLSLRKGGSEVPGLGS